jgi:predicted nucleotidyltransferase
VTLLASVATILRTHGTPFALIGAGAMAVHGVSRSTRDLDVLVTDVGCLTAAYWDRSKLEDVEITMHRGDADDPLAGVVRLRPRQSGGPLDVIIGRSGWVSGVLQRAAESEIDGVQVPVARRADLILLKLYAGGAQDAWDIEQLLAGAGSHLVIADVERELPRLPPHASQLWRRIRG